MTERFSAPNMSTAAQGEGTAKAAFNEEKDALHPGSANPVFDQMVAPIKTDFYDLVCVPSSLRPLAPGHGAVLS